MDIDIYKVNRIKRENWLFGYVVHGKIGINSDVHS